jgi:oligosaccharide repeat unit polymerase
LAAGLAAIFAATTLIQVSLGMPAAWPLLSLCAVLSTGAVIWGLATGRALEPLPVIAALALLGFVVRPLQLFLEWPDLYSHFFPKRGAAGLVLLENQEIANYVTERLGEPLEPALTRAIGACAMFLSLFCVGYALPFGERLRRRVARFGERAPQINLRVAVASALAIGFAAQLAIVVRAGGPAASLRRAVEQTALSDSFVLFVLSGFGFAGMVVWAAWRWPRSRLEWTGFALCVLGNCAFALAVGSRARVFLALMMLAVVRHYRWRPWRMRYLVAGFLVFAMFSGSYLAFRQISDVRPLSEAAREAPQYALEPRVLLNDTTSFDHVFYVTSIYGRERPHEHGGFALKALRSYVPSAIDPDKPVGGDIILRRVVFGAQYGAGRPPTVVGDLYIDFGLAGVGVGALLLGMLARCIAALVHGRGPGREYRVALYAVLLIVLYEWMVDTLSVTIGFALAFGLPLAFTVGVLGRIRRRAGPRGDVV